MVQTRSQHANTHTNGTTADPAPSGSSEVALALNSLGTSVPPVDNQFVVIPPLSSNGGDDPESGLAYLANQSLLPSDAYPDHDGPDGGDSETVMSSDHPESDWKPGRLRSLRGRRHYRARWTVELTGLKDNDGLGYYQRLTIQGPSAWGLNLTAGGSSMERKLGRIVPETQGDVDCTFGLKTLSDGTPERVVHVNGTPWRLNPPQPWSVKAFTQEARTYGKISLRLRSSYRPLPDDDTEGSLIHKDQTQTPYDHRISEFRFSVHPGSVMSCSHSEVQCPQPGAESEKPSGKSEGSFPKGGRGGYDTTGAPRPKPPPK